MSGMERFVWGYIVRNTEKGPQVIVAEHRNGGEFVFPGGLLKAGKSYIQSAMEHVMDEVGVDTVYRSMRSRTYPKSLARDRISGEVTDKGEIVLNYPDKSMRGRLVPLKPIFPSHRPMEIDDSAVRNPEYVPVSELQGRYDKFSNTCRVLLDMLFEYGFD